MKQKTDIWTGGFSRVLLLVFAVGFVQPVLAGPATEQFAARLCAAWNSSDLPTKLGSESIGGSGWIDVVTGVAEVPAGQQIIASGRFECSTTPEYALVIEKKSDRAMCAAAIPYAGRRTWQFLPNTDNYREYAASFGMGAFYSLWNNGMKGNKGTAWNNSKHFQLFFQLAVREGGEYLDGSCKK